MKWRENLDSYDDLLVSNQFKTKFALTYIIAISGMSVNVKFDSKYLVKLPKMEK